MSEKVTLSPGEKLILLMLCEIYEHLKVKGETDTELIKEAIFSGNLWGLEWELSGIFHGHETPRQVVEETVDILAMWERLEQSFQGLLAPDKKALAETEAAFSDNVRLPGFDGNNESEYVGTARFLIDALKRFQHFKGRELNAHRETLSGHRRMLHVYEPILQQVLNKNFTATQIAQVLSKWRE
ncbi:MAG: YfbU family protein [Terriglobales bacterium]